LTADFIFSKLYNKLRILRELDPKSANAKRPNLAGNNNNKKSADTVRQKPVEDESEAYHLKGVLKAAARLVTAVKDINVSYSENSSSSIYGYLDSTQILGMNLRTQEPGWGYVFGAQPDTSLLPNWEERDC